MSDEIINTSALEQAILKAREESEETYYEDEDMYYEDDYSYDEEVYDDEDVYDEEDSEYDYEYEYDYVSDSDEEDYDLNSELVNQSTEKELIEDINLTFSNEEEVMETLSSKDAFILEEQTIALTDIVGLPFFRESRQETIQGLTESVSKLGRVLKPLDVARIVWNKDTVEEDGYEDIKYLLIDGYRRLYAATRNKHIISELKCTVWNFKNEELAKEMIPLLGFILNRQQGHYPKELWSAYTSLELSYGVTPESFEQLLQLQPGDASKMRDIMTTTYEEPRDLWVLREKSLDQCYTLLMKLKREENQLLKEDSEGLSSLDDSAKDLTGESTSAVLSDAEAREILEMDFGAMELTEEMFSGEIEEDEDDIANYEHKQEVGKRERVNPKLKEAVFERDELTCQCCFEGGSYKLPELIFHHKIPVHAGGVDSMDNGVTLCTNCHLQLHFFERNEKFEGGYDGIPEELKEKFQTIMQMAQIAITAGKLKFKDPKERKRQALQGISYPMPGEDMKLKREVFARLGKD